MTDKSFSRRSFLQTAAAGAGILALTGKANAERKKLFLVLMILIAIQTRVKYGSRFLIGKLKLV